MASKIETLIPYDKALHIIGGAVIFAAFHWAFGLLAIVPVAIATVIGGLICMIGAL